MEHIDMTKEELLRVIRIQEATIVKLQEIRRDLQGKIRNLESALNVAEDDDWQREADNRYGPLR